MKIKPKWKVFMWRLLNKALALKANLEELQYLGIVTYVMQM